MEPEAVLFGLACTATIVCALEQDRDQETRLWLAMLQTLVWAVSNVAWLVQAYKAFPLMDGMLSAYTFLLWLASRRLWIAGFGIVAACQLLLDVQFELTGYDAYSPWARWLDATFALQLLIISYPGALTYVRRLHRRGHRHVRGPA